MAHSKSQRDRTRHFTMMINRHDNNNKSTTLPSSSSSSSSLMWTSFGRTLKRKMIPSYFMSQSGSSTTSTTNAKADEPTVHQCSNETNETTNMSAITTTKREEDVIDAGGTNDNGPRQRQHHLEEIRDQPLRHCHDSDENSSDNNNSYTRESNRMDRNDAAVTLTSINSKVHDMTEFPQSQPRESRHPSPITISGGDGGSNDEAKTIPLAVASSSTIMEHRQPASDNNTIEGHPTTDNNVEPSQSEESSESSSVVMEKEQQQQPPKHNRSLSSVPFCKTFDISEQSIFRKNRNEVTSSMPAHHNGNTSHANENRLMDVPNVGPFPIRRRCRSSEAIYTLRRQYDDIYDDEEDDEEERHHAYGGKDEWDDTIAENFLELVDKGKNGGSDDGEASLQRRQPPISRSNNSNDSSSLDSVSSPITGEAWFTPRQNHTDGFDFELTSKRSKGSEMRHRKTFVTKTELSTNGDASKPITSSWNRNGLHQRNMSHPRPLPRQQQQQQHNRSTIGFGSNGSSVRSRWIIPLEHPLKTIWDVVTVILSIVHTYLTHAAIRDRNVGFYQSPFILFCDVWFLIDILLNFVTERRTANGDVILRDHRSICARYLTSWFAIDALSLFPWEVVFVRPVIEAANRRSLWKKIPLRSKAVLRVTQRLRGRHFRWFGTVARHTKVHGVGSRRLLRLIIKYVPKYFMFLRNMKAIVALRIARFVHWMRRVVLQNGDGGMMAPAHNRIKSDASTRSLSSREFDDEDLLLDGDLQTASSISDIPRTSLSSQSNLKVKGVEVVYEKGWNVDRVDYDDDDDGVPL